MKENCVILQNFDRYHYFCNQFLKQMNQMVEISEQYVLQMTQTTEE